MDAEVTQAFSPDAALRSLTYDQGIALSLVTSRGLNYHEVAERMGRAPSEVLHLLGDALHCLADRITDAARATGEVTESAGRRGPG